MAAATEAKEAGNEHFRAGRIAEALACYTTALKQLPDHSPEALTLQKNVAACHLKKKNYAQAIAACDAALAVQPDDAKALFRRSQAHEGKGDMDSAFRDMATASKFEPHNELLRKEAARLMAVAAEKIALRQSVDHQTSEMIRFALTGDTLEKRQTAVKNCVVLAREGPGARKLFQSGAPRQFLQLLKDPDADIRVHALHMYAQLAENSSSRAVGVLEALSGEDAPLKAAMASAETREARAAVRVLSCMLEALAEAGQLDATYSQALDNCMAMLVQLIKNRSISTEAREVAVNVVMTTAKLGDVAKRFLSVGGVRALLVTAALAPSPLLATATTESSPSSTRGHVSVALQKVFEATKDKGQPNEAFVEACMAQCRFGDDPVGNVAPTNAMIAVMLAVIDIGNQILESGDVFACLMKMAESDCLEAQCAAAEALAFAASDKKRARGIMVEGSGVLKRLYGKELPASIRVRALCGLCKMGAVGGGAPNQRTMDESSMINLAKKLRPFLVNDAGEGDIRRWAAEGIAYLSLDADVKEFAIQDADILRAIHRVCMGGDSTVQYALANMLVNLTNSFDLPDISEEQEELKKLGKFAGENIPEPHEKDGEAFVKKRVDILMEHDFVYALAELSKTQSEGAKEQVARVLLAFCTEPSHRGKVISQGGAKALLHLARENTPKGKLKAAQALAKIAITTDPSVAFPGQRALEVVKPCITLLTERHQLLQFEGAMALTNLAGMNDDLRQKIRREKGVTRLEDLMFEDDIRLRRAGTEALVNLLYCEDVFNMFAKKDGVHFPRVKLWILYSGVMQEEFDMGLTRAAAGGLALMSSSPDVAWRIREEKQGFQILKELLVSGFPELQHRSLYIINNMISVDKELAKEFTDREFLMILVAVTLTSKDENIQELGQTGLKELVKLGLVESMEAIQRIAAESLQEMQAVTDRLKGEARARDGDGTEGAEAAEGDEDEDGDEDEGDEDGDEIAADMAEESSAEEANPSRGGAAVSSTALDEDDGPKIEVLEDLPRDESHA